MKRLVLAAFVVDDDFNMIADNHKYPNMVSVEVNDSHISSYVHHKILSNLEYSILNLTQDTCIDRLLFEQGSNLEIQEEYTQVEIDKTSRTLFLPEIIPACLRSQTHKTDGYISRETFARGRK